MSRRTTSVWTDVHGLLLTAGVLATALGALGVLAGAGNPGLTIASMTVVAATVLVASLGDTFPGLVVGLSAGAMTMALQEFLADGPVHGFVVHAVTAGLLLMLGGVIGLLVDRVRRSRRVTARLADQAVAPVHGTLGLMSAQDAHWRLEEELSRAQLHGRPLTTAFVRVSLTDLDLGGADAVRARRAVARSLETELRPTDVPFVEDDGTFGIILPETTSGAALDVIERALIVARQATFADRAAGVRRRVDEVADVRLGVSHSENDTADADEVLDFTGGQLTRVTDWGKAS
jgi:GGDEF domain-containing protein